MVPGQNAFVKKQQGEQVQDFGAMRISVGPTPHKPLNGDKGHTYQDSYCGSVIKSKDDETELSGWAGILDLSNHINVFDDVKPQPIVENKPGKVQWEAGFGED